jgi:ribosome-associated protein
LERIGWDLGPKSPQEKPQENKTQTQGNLPGGIVTRTSAESSSTSQDSPVVVNPDAKARRSLQLALAAAQVAEEDQGQDIMVLDLRDLTCIFDYFVIASGTSRRQLHAMSEDIDNRLEKELGDKRLGIEGYQGSNWILLDYGNIVIHLFDAETRDYYGMEKLWGEAKRLNWREMSV